MDGTFERERIVASTSVLAATCMNNARRLGTVKEERKVRPCLRGFGYKMPPGKVVRASEPSSQPRAGWSLIMLV